MLSDWLLKRVIQSTQLQLKTTTVYGHSQYILWWFLWGVANPRSQLILAQITIPVHFWPIPKFQLILRLNSQCPVIYLGKSQLQVNGHTCPLLWAIDHNRVFSALSEGEKLQASDCFSRWRHFEDFGCFWTVKLPIREEKLISSQHVGGKNKLRLKYPFFSNWGQWCVVPGARCEVDHLGHLPTTGGGGGHGPSAPPGRSAYAATCM